MNIQKKPPGADIAEGLQSSSVDKNSIADPATISSAPPFSKAFDVVNQGYPVFPVNSKTGDPFSNLEIATLAGVVVPPQGEGGFKLASDDPAVVRAWIDRWPDAQIGVPTGSKTNICCLDIDLKDGRDGFARCDRNGWAIPEAPREQSRSGKGAHILLTMPKGGIASVNNYGKEHKDDRTGIDRKADGGYFIWCGADLTAPRPPAPAWFLDQAGGTTSGSAHEIEEFVAYFSAWSPFRSAFAEQWAPGHLLRECEKIADTGEGDRNGTLSASAFALRWAVLAGFLPQKDVESSLKDAARQCGLPDREALTAITKGLRSKKPVSLPRELRNSPQWLFGGTASVIPAGATSLTAPKQSRLFTTYAELKARGPQSALWLIKGVLPQLGVGIMFGQPGTGKSFMAIDMAVSVVSGRLFNGRKVQPGPVVYIAGEGHAGVGQRIEAKFKQLDSDAGAERLHVSDRSISLVNATGDVDAMFAELDALPVAPSLIIIDTLFRATAGADVNDQVAMTAFWEILDGLKRRYGCCVLVVHHSGRNELQRSFGSVVLIANADFEMSVMQDNEGRALECSKMKDAEEFAPMAFDLNPVQLGLICDQFGDIEAITSLTVDFVQRDVSDKKRDADTRRQAKAIARSPRGKHAQYVGHLLSRITDGILERDGIAPKGPPALTIRIPKTALQQIVNDRSTSSETRDTIRNGVRSLGNPAGKGSPFIVMAPADDGKEWYIASTELLSWSREEEYNDEFPEGVPAEIMRMCDAN